MSKIINIEEDIKILLEKLAINQYKSFKFVKNYNGHSIFKMNIKTGEIYKCELNKTSEHKYELEYDASCVFIKALNEDNAVKKFNKIIDIVSKNKEVYLQTINK